MTPATTTSAATPDGGSLPATPPAPQRSRWRLLAQALGFMMGLGLLWWCAAEALKPENREQLARLGEASAWQVAAMIGLTLLSLALNGSVFWVTLLPVRRLRWLDLVSVNVIASLLALLPFKLSVLFRVLVHRGRDGVPLLTIGAWFGALAAVLLIVIGPTAAASAWAAQAAGTGEGGAPWWWLVLPVAGAVLAAAGMVGVSRAVGTPVGWALVERIAGALPGAGRLLPRAHEGVRMLAAAGPVAAAVAMRLADISVQSARFLLAASIVGQPLSLELAVLAASAYFIIGVVAPTGSLGVREAGTAGVFSLLATDGFMVVVVTITAAETMVLLGGSVAAGMWLRLDRVVRLRPSAAPADTITGAATTPASGT